MSDDKDQDALMDRFIEKIEGKLADAVIAKVSERVEEQIGGVVAKNKELLDKLAESKTANDDFAQLLSDATNKITDAGVTPRKGEGPVQITKSAARDVKQYRAARAEAEERGVPLEIVRGEG